jgi:hypothetical protein
MRSGLREREHADLRDHVDATGRNANLKAGSLPLEVARGKPMKRCAEVLPCADQAAGVFCARFDPHIEVVRGARMAVDTDRIATDDEKPYVMGTERNRSCR